MAAHSSILAWRIPWTESTPSPAFIIYRLFDDSLLTGVRWYLIVVFIFLIIKKLSLFIFGCFYLLFHCCVGFSLVAASRGYSLLLYRSLSLPWLLLLWITGSRRVGFSSSGSWALEHRLNRYGAEAWLLHGMWDLLRSGIELALASSCIGRRILYPWAPRGAPHCGFDLHFSNK